MENYYKPCRELDACLSLDQYWHSKEFNKWFQGYYKIASETSYPLAECQVGYAFLEGIGVERDFEKALYWTKRSAKHGDRDGQCNMAWIYEKGLGTAIDMERAKYWYRQAAMQDHDLAIEKCEELGFSFEAV